MTGRFEDAAAQAQQKREALLATLRSLRRRATPLELAEDLLTTLDPQRSYLQRLSRRIAQNRLLSLAILAGAGWLAGLTRHPDGKPPAAGKPPRAKPKEKNNDSGQQQRNDRHLSGAGQRRKVPRTKGSAQALRHQDFGGQAQPLGGKPQRRGVRTGGHWPQPVQPVWQQFQRPRAEFAGPRHWRF